MKHSFYLLPICFCALTNAAQAQTFEPTGKATASDAFFANTNPWMHGDVWEAWTQGYKGQGAKITVVDNFSGNLLKGTMNGAEMNEPHGQFVLRTASIIARDAEFRPISTEPVMDKPVSLLKGSGINIINMSYVVFGQPGSTPDRVLGPRERSIIQHAQNGAAVVVKSAGNYQSGGFLVTAGKHAGQYLYTSEGLYKAQSAIFVGALERNGSVEDKARLASYSNYAGADKAYQKQFLVVGVDKENMGGLSGTSFAAPIVSGYAAIVGSKFRTTPTKIVNQLLTTARTDTIENYRPEVHGQGEASLSRALAPRSIR